MGTASSTTTTSGGPWPGTRLACRPSPAPRSRDLGHCRWQTHYVQIELGCALRTSSAGRIRAWRRPGRSVTSSGCSILRRSAPGGDIRPNLARWASPRWRRLCAVPPARAQRPAYPAGFRLHGHSRGSEALARLGCESCTRSTLESRTKHARHLPLRRLVGPVGGLMPRLVLAVPMHEARPNVRLARAADEGQALRDEAGLTPT